MLEFPSVKTLGYFQGAEALDANGLRLTITATSPSAIPSDRDRRAR
jgi:hypothetical protein